MPPRDHLERGGGKCLTFNGGFAGVLVPCTDSSAQRFDYYPTGSWRCGDGTCQAGETNAVCPSDCAAPPRCGDGVCNGTDNCANCASDCGVCEGFCGDGVCMPNETRATCAADCTPEDPACFVAGTDVTMADGTTKPIEQVTVGDVVLSYDESTGAQVPGRVVNTFVHPTSDRLVRLNGVVTTLEHRFFSNGAWVAVGALPIGAELLDRAGRVSSVQHLQLMSERATTYNFEVAGTHNYYAGGYLVHNKKAQ